ncbi:MAG: HigA family addiction module antitoxin [Chloroflexi bacterium]|nr:HigA family addiction module antitoxin [Chloroflexota bacterium]
MVDVTRNEYQPDYVTPPGETLLETLAAVQITQVELAERTGNSPQAIEEIVNNKTPITAEIAGQLERVLGVPTHFWLNRERRYQESGGRA